MKRMEREKNKKKKEKKPLTKVQIRKMKPRVPGSTTFIHKAEKFNNNVFDKRPVTMEEAKKKTLKILDPVKIERQKKKEEDERIKQEKIEAAKQSALTKSGDAKVKKIRPRDIVYDNPIDALKALKLEEEVRTKGTDQTIEFVLKLDVRDAKRGVGQVRGLVTFPGGAVKAPKLCVFVGKDQVNVALEAGADMIGDANLVKQIIEGKELPFEKCLATTEAISILKSAARYLGPKGLMPNPKGGTLVEPKLLEDTIREIKAGKKEFRINPGSQIRISLGKRSFTDDNLMKNMDSICGSIWDSKPEGVKHFLQWAFFFPTRGRVYRINVNSLNPFSEFYFYDDYQNMKRARAAAAAISAPSGEQATPVQTNEFPKKEEQITQIVEGVMELNKV
jgi:large subunit ribosomal protein L1